jgi:hypothetical protein
MPLFKPVPPTTATEAFRAGLSGFLSGPAFGRAGKIAHQNDIGGIPVLPTEADFGGPGPWDHDPQQVFTLGLSHLQTAADTNAAKPAAWRYFAGNAYGKTVLGHCSADAATGLWELASLSYGDRVWQALRASQSLDLQPGISLAHSYELRVLKIPGLLLEAFWLVSSTGGTDLAVVFPPPPYQLHRRLNARAVYEMPVFLDIARALAIDRLRFGGQKGS